jgi:hypothetical protein
MKKVIVNIEITIIYKIPPISPEPLVFMLPNAIKVTMLTMSRCAANLKTFYKLK